MDVQDRIAQALDRIAAASDRIEAAASREDEQLRFRFESLKSEAGEALERIDRLIAELEAGA
ncbi:hypothetical protein [Aurantiacibacter spongiae]|uniref:Uncharacterized protein n=1 Tax=Aurantiacibacter spongiae TaxID=2488860 RepID=A0A3N5DN78_9SPHN|nr:hypothetical protein [Aurantiacibacter spongiae]RPF70491.1 hypothetical protein EG799_01750 [Aurantiacibacter spongiae]